MGSVRVGFSDECYIMIQMAAFVTRFRDYPRIEVELPPKVLNK